MKLPFDENLSPKLVQRLADLFPQSAHVHECGLGQTDDLFIWDFARQHGFIIISKDADFHDLSVLKGAPPKLIHLRSGNASLQQTEAIIRSHAPALQAFETDPYSHFLILS
jgi:predicted nuclease of predicted toxin-antitoxin system